MSKMSFLCIMIAAAFLATACGKKAEERRAERAVEKAIAKETGGKVKADLSKDKVQIKTEKGEVTITEAGGAEVPEGFPKDVLVYRGASVMMSAKEQNTLMVWLESKDDLKKVVETYKENMKSQGWEEKSAMSLPAQVSLQYEKDKRTVSISVTKEDDKSRIQIVVVTEEE